MALFNLWNEDTKLATYSLTWGTLTATALKVGTGLTLSTIGMAAIPVAAAITGLGYAGRSIIDFQFRDSATKCNPQHSLYKTVHQVIDSHEIFKHLNNIDIFVYNDNEPNAFACGFTTSQAAVYVSTGLINTFKNDPSNSKLKAVIAHELGHIAGHHMQINSVVMTFQLLTKFAKLSLDYKINQYDKLSLTNKDDTKAVEEYQNSKFYCNVAKAGLKVFEAVSAPAVSRQLEYHADKTATKAGYGNDLIKALNDIANRNDNGIDSYISETFSTHPTLANRAIAIHRTMNEENYHYNDIISYTADSLKNSYNSFIGEHTSHFYPTEMALSGKLSSVNMIE